ncbi:hypothetical protein [Cryobacterium sp. AP23]
MGVKLSGSLPDADRQGPDKLQGQLVKHPDDRHLVIMVINSPSVKVDHGQEGDTYTPTAGVLFAEPVLDRDDINEVLEIMGRCRAIRLDDATLDFDFGIGDPLADAAKKFRDSGVTVEFGPSGGRE